MRTKTTTALAVTGALLSVPAARADDPLRTALGGHETMAAQMRAEARDNRRDDLARRTFRVARRVAVTTAGTSRRARSDVGWAA